MAAQRRNSLNTLLGAGRGRVVAGFVIAASLLAVPGVGESEAVFDQPLTRKDTGPMRLQSVPFSEIPEWQTDDHAAALTAFGQACRQISRASPIGGLPSRRKAIATGLREICGRLRASPKLDVAAARAFFERNFTAYSVTEPAGRGILTGYFEPELDGSRTRTDEYNLPLYRQPSDLVKLSSDAMRGADGDKITASRRTPGGKLVPYYTRREIDEGALAGRGLELLYLKDPIDSFFLHVQGSGVIRLREGGTTRIGFAAKNGYPYTSIGRVLIDRGEIPADKMSLIVLRQWLEANPSQTMGVLHENKSFIFFNEMSAEAAKKGTVGAQGVPLTPGRSLAVDTAFHVLGTPIYVVGPEIRHHGAEGFAHLMIAQDVGSAIKGQERGDIFWGTGDEAGYLAGETRHGGRFYVLLPRGA